MKRQRAVVFPTFLLFFGLCGVALSQRIPERNTPNAVSQPHPMRQPIAIARQRISRDNQTIEISRGNQGVVLDHFTDLVVVTMTDEKTQLEKLRGQAITLARNAKQRAKWDVFTGGMGGYPGDAMTLLDNVFRIQDVLLSTAENQVKLQVDGQVYRLRPGEVLFVLD